MTRQVAEAAGVEARNLPVLQEHEEQKTVGILLVTGDRGLAGSFNSQIIRAGVQLQRELAGEGKEVRFSVVGRRGVSTMRFRGEELARRVRRASPTARPSRTRGRSPTTWSPPTSTGT